MAQSMVPVFAGENYDIWSIKMRTLLLSQGLWDIVENGYQEYSAGETLTAEQKKSLAEDRMSDAKALFLIQQGVAESLFPRIIGAKKSKEAWDKLKEEFQGSQKVLAVKLQTLRRQFQNLLMKESEKVKDYFPRVIEIVNQMRLYGEDINDQKVVEKILISLPEKYEYIVAAIEESKDLSTLTIQQLMSSLESHEERKLQREGSSIENAFQSKLSFRPQNSRFRGNFQKNEFPMRDRGYFQKNGFSRQKEDGQERREKELEKLIGLIFHKKRKKSEEMVFSCHTAQEEKDDVWVIDSGCTNHMAADPNLFREMDSSYHAKIHMGNGSIAQSEGKGQPHMHGTHGVEDHTSSPQSSSPMSSSSASSDSSPSSEEQISTPESAPRRRVLRYIKGTADYGIWYKPVKESKLIGYTDSDWAGCLDDMKSTSGYAFSLGSAEAEYVAASKAVSQVVWLRRIMEDLGEKQYQPTTIYCDDLAGGPRWRVQLGRRDATATNIPSADNLPGFTDTLEDLVAKFDAVGLDHGDLVALQGAHTFGRAQCLFTRENCTAGQPDDALENLDPVTPDVFDNNYYGSLLRGTAKLPSDQVMLSDDPYAAATTAPFVRRFAGSQKSFFRSFAASMIKMGNISPLTGMDGQIRQNCRRINTYY
ncbi:Os10g0106900 [Oryza sativa Japonica Group]|uniref:Os10g0106900 protein n=1 Tax=Oryza sativa subsp. japonica TaxID=39947 RepID=Q0IZC5_ORYSJ|nr:Os10g0106900 [Oryza sativa Japonica Group]|eukprot:NP_001064026.2 Os10g0106900 [Oryza sativa Japonica Group]